MKSIFKSLLWVAIGSVLFISCKEDPSDVESKKSYLGEMTVTNADSSTFSDPEIRVSISESITEEGKYDILMKQVKFAERMPVRIDMTIPSVELNAAYELICDSVIPWAMGGPYTQWTIRNLRGQIIYTDGEPSEISFEMMCGDYPVVYQGLYTEE